MFTFSMPHRLCNISRSKADLERRELLRVEGEMNGESNDQLWEAIEMPFCMCVDAKSRELNASSDVNHGIGMIDENFL